MVYIKVGEKLPHMIEVERRSALDTKKREISTFRLTDSKIDRKIKRLTFR